MGCWRERHPHASGAERWRGKRRQIAWLWIAARLTGLLIQPVVGQMSDRCWTGIGRRRPFILGGVSFVLAALLTQIIRADAPSPVQGGAGH